MKGILFFLVQVTVTISIIVRIRLPSGVMHRITVDEDMPSETFLQMLVNQSYSTINSTYSNGLFTFSNHNLTGNVIQALSLKHGDIIQINDHITKSSNSSLSKKNIVDPIYHHNVSNTQTMSTSKSSKPSKGYQKKQFSMSDLLKEREGMIKISREKAPSDKMVAISSSTGRILKRISTGGIGLAFGRITSTYKKTKNNKNVNRGKTVPSKRNTKEDEKNIVLYEIHAICELFSCEDESIVLPWVISQSIYEEIIHKIQSIATSLGLTIIGCCVSLPIVTKSLSWTSYHVHSLLQIQNILNQRNLVMISVIKSGLIIDTDLSNKSKRKYLQDKDLGISMEAFLMSNQSELLYNSSILASIASIEDQVQLKLLSSSSDSSTTLKSIASMEESVLAKISKIRLQKNVLLQSTETSIVDALLFAVPLPVIPLLSMNSKSNIPMIEYEHSFPSTHELKNEKMMKIAKKHVLKILGSTTSSMETIQRLRDPHLLLYLKDILDELSFDALCKALVNTSWTDRLPGNVVAALDMIKMVLTS